MGEHTFTLLFALFYALAYCSSHQGGNSSTQLSFCNIPGCGSHVNNVFCNDVLLFSGGPITNCTGPPPHNNVCQHKGLAFVSADPDSRCDFEGKDGHIESDICTVDHSSICASLTENSSIFLTPTANTSSPDNVPTRKHYGSIVGVCILLLIILIAVLAGIYCRHSQQQQARNSSENSAAAVPLDSKIRE